jgi:DNA-binding transcriptional LysR family regulator
MFERLFAESGLSLDRVRALLEVGATGSIVKAAGGDAVRQSQYSRQIKELENFFQTKLVERHGKGIRMTANGKELARISRFFLLGLSNFQRGCLTEKQMFRVGASATFNQCFLLPLLADPQVAKADIRYATEIVAEDELERRLHDLTLDFGITTAAALSRPLQLVEVGKWRLTLWVPTALFKTERQAEQAYAKGQLRLAWAEGELNLPQPGNGNEPFLLCSNFLEARTALQRQTVSAFLPGFLEVQPARAFFKLCPTLYGGTDFYYRLAWNPRMLRLNPHAARRRDVLLEKLSALMRTGQ